MKGEGARKLMCAGSNDLTTIHTAYIVCRCGHLQNDVYESAFRKLQTEALPSVCVSTLILCSVQLVNVPTEKSESEQPLRDIKLS